MQQPAAGEQRDDRAEGQERARTGSPSCVPSSRGGRRGRSLGTSAAIIPTISATATLRPSTAPISSASLTSPIPIPAGYASAASRRKPDAPSAASAHSGLGWITVCATSADRRGRQHDPVRDDPVLEVDRRDHDEHDAEARGDDRVGGEPELPERAGDEQRRRRARRRVAHRDRRAARAAAAAQERPREQRDVVAPGGSGSAAHAGRRRVHDRAPQRHARGDDVQEAADREAGREEDGGESHALRIVRTRGGV